MHRHQIYQALRPIREGWPFCWAITGLAPMSEVLVFAAIGLHQSGIRGEGGVVVQDAGEHYAADAHMGGKGGHAHIEIFQPAGQDFARG